MYNKEIDYFELPPKPSEAPIQPLNKVIAEHIGKGAMSREPLDKIISEAFLLPECIHYINWNIDDLNNQTTIRVRTNIVKQLISQTMKLYIDNTYHIDLKV